MSEFFLELFSEEIPSGLQTSAREMLSKNFKDFFDKENIEYSQSYCFSTPNRLLIFFKEIKKEVIQKSEEIKGPNLIKGINMEGLRVLGDPNEFSNY